MRAIGVLAVASTFAAGPLATVATAEPLSANASQAETRVSTTDHKLAVGQELGVPVGPTQWSMRDCSFTIYVWNWASDQSRIDANSKVAEAAATAFSTNDTDPESCYRFITDTVFTAHEADVVERLRKAERDRQRVAAAAVISWSNLTQDDLNCSLKDFVFRIWSRAATGSEVKAKAAAVLTPTSTDAERTTYIATGVRAAADIDQQRALEEAQRIERERQERLANEQARASAWNIVARTVMTDDLKLVTDREFVYGLASKATTMPNSKWRKADAQAAADSTDPAVWKAFIFTGVHAAYQKDLEEQNRVDAIETEARIKEILDAAVRDGFMPNVVVAARTALTSDLAARHAFLNVGRDAALKRDQIKPSNGRVIELQGKASKRCIQVVGAYDQADDPGMYQELWDCLVAPKQVYELYKYDDDQYMIRNLHSKMCLDAVGDLVLQNSCESGQATLRWKFIENPADGSFQIQNVATGRFATVKEGGTANAALIVQHTNTKAADQLWRVIDPTHREAVVPVQTGWTHVKGVHSGRCMQTAGFWDVPNQGANGDLAGQELWDCVGGGKMKWNIIALGENKYALQNAQSGKCLDVRYGDWQRGTSLVQFTCHHGGTQQFVFTQEGDSTYGLQSALTFGYADAVGSASGNGALVQTWDYTGFANQRWTLVPQPA
ncbi:RICIN domain-containing protein [Lentzea flaviverrucosa]|uniref:Ricin-type beta-trefoil lectin domain-containing protein n=1 Tax=Lentzea flaviverrucosa TaxID=200379 RepID=A0A1H9K993_9PSEU|nr:RICIN domain-containing protein [Lentzea flaviverrucosa]RDI17790.1 ricin-type beta-trefoil lectin protein [Lentzea flaviverrucosa]SEQ95483.1 Ricin-type beta-trefoil lectin domain-containing protein [Lentzea flaviverrucosa]